MSELDLARDILEKNSFTCVICKDGKTLTTDDNALVYDGYFHESETISAPSFDIRIDGIKLLNEEYGN